MNPRHVHHVPDYTGRHEGGARRARRSRSSAICREHGYDYVFAGYGFMAEDAGLRAHARGGGAHLHRPVLVHADRRRREGRGQAHGDRERRVGDAGLERRDRCARCSACIPTARRSHAAREGARPRRSRRCATRASRSPALAEEIARGVVPQARRSLLDRRVSARRSGSRPSSLLREQPGRRFRLKAIGGGGGKGQRIFGDAAARCRRSSARCWPRSRRPASATTRTCCSSSTSSRPATTRSRSSATARGASRSAAATARCRCTSRSSSRCRSRRRASPRDRRGAAAAGNADEGAGARERTSPSSSAWRPRPSASATAVKLDSASTFECIVDGDRHYFMEVNTRIQVEHRVSELCYALRFANPDDPERRVRGAVAGRGDGADRAAQARLPKPVARPARGRRDRGAL